MRFLKILIVLLCLGLGAVVATSYANDSEKSSLIRFVENQISSPNMQIRLNGLEGSLSSDVSLTSITIGDERGVWLTIVKPRLIWNRSALFRGRVDVETLTAERIDFPRKPLPDKSLPNPEATTFAIPELPVSVILKKLSVPVITFGPEIFGRAATISTDGRMTLDGGSLDLDMAIKRLDGSKGALDLRAAFDGGEKTFDIDARLAEPRGGIVASLLGLDGKPPITLAIKGSGPVANLRVGLLFDVAEQRILEGALTLQEQTSGLLARAEMGGPLSQMLPERHKSFFGSTSRLSASALFGKNGGIQVSELSLESGSINLKADAELLSDGFLNALNIDLSLLPNGEERVVLPSQAGTTSVARANLEVKYDARNADDWRGILAVSGLRTNGLSAEKVEFRSAGVVQRAVDASSRALRFQMDGTIDEITTNDSALADALGKTIRLESAGSWSSSTAFVLDKVQLAGSTFAVDLSGSLRDLTFDGKLGLSATRLAAFSALAGRPLKGAAKLTASGKVLPFSGRFDINLDGTTEALSIGDPIADALLAGRVVLTGGVARTLEGIRFQKFQMESDGFQTAIDGRFASDFSDLKAVARIHDLARISPNAQGPLDLAVDLTGREKPFKLAARLGMATGNLLKKPVDGLSLSFSGSATANTFEGQLSGGGAINDRRTVLAAGVEVNPDVLRLSDLTAKIGATDIAGGLRRGSDGLIDGDLVVASADISDLAALFLTKARGGIRANIKLIAGDEGNQMGSANVTVNRLTVDTMRIGKAEVKSSFDDLFTTPKINAEIGGSDIAVAGFGIRVIETAVSTVGQETDFRLNADLTRHRTQLATQGRVVFKPNDISLTLSKLSMRSVLGDARLTKPARLVHSNEETRISETVFAIGGGSVRAEGRAGKTLALRVAIAKLPLSIANAVAPNLGAAGTVSGDVTISGTQSEPVVAFKATGAGISTRQLAGFGLRPLRFSADGRASKAALSLTSVRVSNSQKLDVSASGTIATSGEQLRIAVKGGAPLSLAQPLLAERGTTLTGTARFDMNVTGSARKPNANGRLTISSASVSDPLSNLKLVAINVAADLAGDRIAIRRTSARLATGGSLSASGTIGLGSGLPANINLRLSRARYTDGETFDTTVSGDLSITGNVAAGPKLGGTLTLNKTEVTIPESFAADSKLLKVKDVEPPEAVRTTLSRLRATAPKDGTASRRSPMRLDIVVNAPNRIFIRGRGLDSEIGGNIQVYGSVDDLTTSGAFQLRRGRLRILGRRLDLERVSVTLDGNFDPLLDILAQTSVDDVTIYVGITGRANKPKVTFTSQPELPEDEVLARLVFGRGLDDLSPSQLVRLASIAAELTGGSSPGLVDGLRGKVGLDDLDIVEDSDGNTAVKAGKYISDNAYVGVQAGKKRQEVTVNIDITNSLTVRGAVGSDGETKTGIFFEKDY